MSGKEFDLLPAHHGVCNNLGDDDPASIPMKARGKDDHLTTPAHSDDTSEAGSKRPSEVPETRFADDDGHNLSDRRHPDGWRGRPRR